MHLAALPFLTALGGTAGTAAATGIGAGTAAAAGSGIGASIANAALPTILSGVAGKLMMPKAPGMKPQAKQPTLSGTLRAGGNRAPAPAAGGTYIGSAGMPSTAGTKTLLGQ